MNDKNTIINKIIDNANLKSEDIIQQALLKKEEIIKEANKKAKEYKEEVFPDKKAFIDDLVQRGMILSNLEAKKVILAKKKSIIDDIFKLALQDLKIKENQAKYKKLVENMIKENAENLDTVQFAESDKKIFDNKFLQAVAKKLDITLKLEKNYGEFLGGVVLSNKNCDKNLTLELELESLRSALEADLAKTIFGA